MDIGVHSLDMAMWLMGFPEPVSVTGCATSNLAKSGAIPGEWGAWDARKFDVEDFACGMVRFKTGAMLSLESCWLAHVAEPETMSCTILGDKAGVNWPSGKVSTVCNGALVDSVIKPLPLDEDHHDAEIRAFFDAIVNNKPSPVPAEQTLKVIKILDGIYRSQRSGKEVRL
jgi:predicted dehydrogenase